MWNHPGKPRSRTAAGPTTAKVTGPVTYRERIALSPEAVVGIKLIDVSRADAPAVTIGEQTIKDPGQVPVSFEIEYDPTAIDPRFTYAVRATITERGTLAFTSDTAYHVITRDNPTQVDMVLKRVASTPPATESSTPATVTGTVTYRERIALSPDAVVEVKLVDVSRADAPAVTIGEQTIKNPGQVPIAFEIGYDPKTIDSRFTYAVQARIEERGTLMFINDTRYQVITRGNPAHVDMVLKRVGGSTPAGPKPPESPKNGMVAVPAPIESVDLSISSSNPPEYSLLIVSGLPGGCVEFEDHAINLVDKTFEVTVTNLGPAPGSMVICTAIYGYHESRIAIGDELEPREAYTIKVNGEVTTSFTAPDVRGPAMEEKTSPIARVDVKTSESDPAEYSLLVISRLPLGSNCSRFNGFDVSRRFAGTIDVAVTHLEATENDVPCTRDLPIVATRIPLGSEFKSGETYTVVINETVTETFVGR